MQVALSSLDSGGTLGSKCRGKCTCVPWSKKAAIAVTAFNTDVPDASPPQRFGNAENLLAAKSNLYTASRVLT